MLRQSIVFSIFLVFLIGTSVGAERAFSLTFQSCVGGNQKSDERVGPEKNPPALASNITLYMQCSGIFLDQHGAGITALASVIIAAFTGTLWVATSRQAELTKEALVADKRAFVFLTGFNQTWLYDVASDQYHWRFRPNLRNSGDTPTKQMTMYVECEIRNTSLPPNYPFNYQSFNVAGGTIPPKFELQGGLAPHPPDSGVTPQDIIDSQLGRKYIYIWGWVKYRDVFPGTEEHITRYCFLITPVGDPLKFVPNTPGQPPTLGTLAFPYIYHNEGNCIDNECS